MTKQGVSGAGQGIRFPEVKREVGLDKDEERKPEVRQEEVKQEEARQEEARQEEARQEEARQEEARQEEARQEEARQEGARQEEVKREEAGDGFLAKVREVFPGKKQDIRSYSPLTLAYIGDAVYDLIIRTVVVERANRPANDLHHIAVKYVNAGAQARIVIALADRLTEEEQSVYHRGKNAKPHTMAKNASPGDYRKATGFEAVLGWLYLRGELDRILELVKEGIAAAELEI